MTRSRRRHREDRGHRAKAAIDVEGSSKSHDIRLRSCSMVTDDDRERFRRILAADRQKRKRH